MSLRRPRGRSWMSSPPRLARFLAQRWVSERDAEFIVGDLDEDYAETCARRGVIAARLRYWKLALESIRESGRGGPAGRPYGFGGLGTDVRFGARMLVKHPGFTAVAILTLALGIGANTVLFSVLNGVLLRPLPYDEPGEIVNVWQVFYEWQDSDVEVFRDLADRFPASYPVYEAWADRGHVFESIAAYSDFLAIVEGPDLAEYVAATQSTAALFEVLGVEPQLGRGFTSDEDHDGAERVVVLSHGFWLRHFGGDPAALGRTLSVTGVPHTIIGVMPAGFYFPDRTHELWVLLREGRRNDRWSNQSLQTIARLREGVSVERAQAEMSAVTLGILEDNPESPEVGIRIVGRVDEVVGSTRQTLLLVMAAVGLVLVVACANIAGLLLVRATSRRPELAIRRALGAGRGRLTLQLLFEAGLLTGGGGLLGLLTAGWSMSWLRSILPPSIPRVDDIAIDWRVLVFAFAVSAAITVAFGAAAAFHAGRRSLLGALREGDRGALGTRRRGRTLLVVGEITVAVVLLVLGSLLLNSYLRLNSVERGFDEDDVLTFTLTAPLETWDDTRRVRAFFHESFDRIHELPGVVSLAAVSSLPFSGGQSSTSFGLVEDPQTDDEAGWSLEEAVTVGYFETMGIPLLRGRTFNGADTAAAEQVAIVNERLARYYWPEGDPLGKTIWDEDQPYAIVGVVGNVKHNALDEEVERKRYRVYGQEFHVSLTVVVRTAAEPTSLVAAVRGAVRDVDPKSTVTEVASMSELVARSTALARFRAGMLTSLAAIVVVLAMLGVYGVVAFGVAQRTREMGLRMALGAGRRRILGQVLSSGLRLIASGVVVGTALALGAVRLIESHLYGIAATDAPTFAAAALTVSAVATLATWIPARRATRIEPLIILRGD